MSSTEPVKIQLGARRERIALVLGILLILVAGLPLYWLNEPGRQNGATHCASGRPAHGSCGGKFTEQPEYTDGQPSNGPPSSGITIAQAISV